MTPEERFEEVLQALEHHQHEFGQCDGGERAWSRCPVRARIRSAHAACLEEAKRDSEDVEFTKGRMAGDAEGYRRAWDEADRRMECGHPYACKHKHGATAVCFACEERERGRREGAEREREECAKVVEGRQQFDSGITKSLAAAVRERSGK